MDHHPEDLKIGLFRKSDGQVIFVHRNQAQKGTGFQFSDGQFGIDCDINNIIMFCLQRPGNNNSIAGERIYFIKDPVKDGFPYDNISA